MTFGDEWGWGSPKADAQKVYARQAETSLTQRISTPVARAKNSWVSSPRAIRDSGVLATKYSNAAPGNDPTHRKNMMQALEASLKRLQIDYIDLYWVHIWDGITPVEEVMRGLDDLVRAVKILYAGISDAPAWWIAQANTLAELRGWTQFIGLKIEYSHVERTVERELIPMAKALNVRVLAWSPLASGVLSGKYHGEGKADGARMANEGMKEFLPEEQHATRIISAVKAVSEQVGRSMAQVALAWLRRQTVPVIPIIGARKVSQLQDNLGSLDLELSAEQLKSVDGASRIELGFPQSLYEGEMVRSIRYGSTWDRLPLPLAPKMMSNADIIHLAGKHAIRTSAVSRRVTPTCWKLRGYNPRPSQRILLSCMDLLPQALSPSFGEGGAKEGAYVRVAL
jgi:aryl-alcohol dehydrogenase-like predicted oxidoreductase